MAAVAFGEPVRSRAAPGGHRAAAALGAAAAVAYTPGAAPPPRPRTPRTASVAVTRQCPRGMLGHSTYAAPAADTPDRSRPVAAAAEAPVDAAHSAPRARAPREARSAAAEHVQPPRYGARGAATRRSGPAAARAAAG